MGHPRPTRNCQHSFEKLKRTHRGSYLLLTGRITDMLSSIILANIDSLIVLDKVRALFKNSQHSKSRDRKPAIISTGGVDSEIS